MEAGKTKGSDRGYKLMMKGEDVSRDLTNYAYSRLMGRPVQLMPAQCGIYALAVSTDDGEPQLCKTPVIA